MRDRPISKIIQDISALIGSLLPLAQLFFNQWISAFEALFLAKMQFIGVSILTLIVSYVLILGYLKSPWGEVVLPFQRRRNKKIQDYYARLNNFDSTISTLQAGLPQTANKIESISKKKADLKQPPSRVTINSQNIMSIVILTVIVSTAIFILLSLFKNAPSIVAGVQSLTYTALIASAALALTIYKTNGDNQTTWQSNQASRADRAIKLAIDANGFTNLPQVKFILQQEITASGGFGNHLYVVAEYNKRRFEIVTDSEARYLIRVNQQSVD